MKKYITKRQFSLALISLLGGCLVLSLVWLGLKNQSVVRHDENAQANDKVRYVLVNQDNGAKFNGKEYNLGGDFLKLVSRDKEHDWQTAPSDMAAAGMNDGTYDVEVVIPENFSARILALQSTDPKQAGISYRVRKGQNEITNQVVGRNVDSLINYFNNRVVRMYFSSLVGNLRSAQVAMQRGAKQQKNQVSELSNRVQAPFQGLNDQFATIFSTASVLDEDRQASVQADEAFSQSVQALLQGLDQGLTSNNEAEQTTRTALHDKLEEQIKLYEALTKKSSAYQLNVGNYFTDTAPVLLLHDTSAALVGVVSSDQVALTKQLQQLNEQYQTLHSLQQQLEKEYGLTQTTVEENLTTLKARLNGDNGNNTQSLTAFEAQIKKKLSKLGVATELTRADGELKDLWSKQDQNDYQVATQILSKYAKNLGIDHGKQVTYLKENAKEENYPAKVTLNLTADKPNVIQLKGDGTAVTLTQNNIVSTLQQAGYQDVKMTPISQGRFTVSFTRPQTTTAVAKDKSDPEVATSSKDSASANDSSLTETSSTTQEKTPPQTPSVSPLPANYAVEMTVDYQIKETTDYEWSVNDQVQNTGRFVVVTQKNSTDLNQNVAQTLALAHEVMAVYSKEEDLGNFLATQEQDKIVASPDSLAALVTKSAKLSPELEQYATKLVEQYAKLSQQVDRLGKATGQLTLDDQTSAQIKTLNEISQSLNEAGLQSYLKQVAEIIEWYNKAQLAVNADKNERADVEDLPLIMPNATAEVNSEQLTQQYQTLKASLTTGAKELTTTDKVDTKGVRPLIQELTNNTTKLQQTTEGIKTSLDQNLKNSQKQANNDQDYAKAFNTVMQNARNGEADNSKVYNFLTDPIKATGSYTAMPKHSLVPYFMTVIGSLSAVFIGFGIAKYLPKRTISEKEALIEHTRAWLNLPSVILTFALSLGLGMIFALSTYSVAESGSKSAWFIYAITIMTLLTSLITAGARMQREVTLFIFGLVLGLYILLTPFLGILVKAGTFVQVLYRFSPLQNIEAGYAALVSGGTVGLVTWSGLVLAIVAVFLASLFLRPLTNEVVVKDDDEN
ncbi:MAG TPA: type VII secretion protein EsaA [Lactobacillus sp.]|uniref:type VII secretion protein EsaA n=1 Tax=Ligilactobacillus murinus TaxID=1622 RepID=UPI00096E4762|nr:type VII secretion protein EsaA [Ligilactobacillus murinus]HAB50554.1 type VII secretion protein EsaA [Lactobacillus sp.]